MAQKDLLLVLEFDDKGSPKIKKVIKDVDGALGKLGADAAKSGKGFNKLKKDVDNSAKGLSRFSKGFKSMAGQMAMGMGVMMGVQGIFRILTKTISDTMRVGREFEAGWANVTTMMTEVDGVIEDTTMTFDDMRESLLQMSPALGGALELSKGLYQVLSASVPAAEAIEFLGMAARSAKAGMTDTFTAVDAMTTALNAYKATGITATQISDVMFATIKRGKLNYEGMAGALGTVVPMASQVGVKFQEIAAAMATLTRQGIDVNTATVQLRQIMVGVLKPTEQAKKEAKRLKIEFTALALKTKGLAKFLAEIQEKTKGNSVSMAQLFGNVRSLTGVMGLSGGAAAGFAKDLGLTEEAMEGASFTADALEKQMQTSTFWMLAFGVAMDKLKLSIYDGLTKPLKEGIGEAENAEERMEDLQKKMMEAGEKIGTSIGKVIKNIIDLKDTIITLGKVLGLVFVVAKISKWTMALSTGIMGATTKMTLFGTATRTTGVAVAGLGLAFKLLLAFKIGWEIGKWIGKITGLNKVIEDTTGKIVDLVGAWQGLDAEWSENHTAAETKRFDRLSKASQLAGQEIKTIAEAHRILAKEFEKTRDLGSKTLNDWAEGYVKTEVALLNLKKTVTEAADDIVTLEQKFLSAWQGGKLVGTELETRVLAMKDAFEAAGKEVLPYISKIIAELDKQKQVQAEATAAWRKQVDSFKTGISTMGFVNQSFKAMKQAMGELEKGGASADAVMKAFEKSILELYKQGKLAKEMFGKEMPEGLEKMAQSFGKVEAATASAAFLIGGVFTPQMLSSIEGLKKYADMINELGLSFETDLIAGLEKTTEAYETFTSETWKGAKLTKASQLDLVENIIKYHTELGREVPEKWKLMYEELSKDTESGVRDITGELEKLGQLINILGSEIGGSLGGIVSTIGVGLQQALSAVKSGVKGIGPILESIAPMLGQLGGQIGSMISKTEKNFAALGSSIGSTIGGIFGPLGKAAGSLVGGLIGGLFGIKDAAAEAAAELEQLKKEAQSMASEMGKAFKSLGEVSSSTLEKMAKARQEGMKGWIAESMFLNDIIKDTGVTTENMNKLWGRTTDLLSQIRDGHIDASKGVVVLSEAFEQMLAGAKELGREGSQEMVRFIQSVRESGLEVAGVSDYVLEQLMRIPAALNTLASNIFQTPQKYYKEYDKFLEASKDSELKFSDWLQAEHKDRWDGIGRQLDDAAVLAGNTFKAMVAEGMSYMDIVKAMKDPLTDLINKYDELGMAIPEALKPMEGLIRLMDEKPKIIENLDASITMLDAFRNSAYMTQETFDVLVKSVAKFAKEILGVEGNLNSAMKTMDLTNIQIEQLLPMVSQFVGAAAMFGLGVPAWMKSFVSEQLDVPWEEFKETAKNQANAGINTVEKLKKIIEQNRAISKAQRDLDKNLQDQTNAGFDTLYSKLDNSIWRLKNDLVGAISGVTNAVGSIPYIKPKAGENGIEAQEGFQGYVTKTEQPFVAHKGEFVSITPAKQVSANRMPEQQNITVVIEPVTIDKGNEVMIDFIVKKIQRGDVQVPITSVRG